MQQCHHCGVHFAPLDSGDHLCGGCRDELLTSPRADAASARRAPSAIDALMDTICDDCPAVWQYSCACYGWCMRTGAALPDPPKEEQ